MSAPKWTPGPYRAHPVSIPEGRNVRFEILAPYGDDEECVVARTTDDGSPVGEATAHLLAAAPELAEALRAILAAEPSSARTANGKDLERHEERQARLIRPARAALAKAEGRA